MIEKYRSFVFDCDGVILDSNRIKTEAFRKALADEPVELVDQFIQYHKNNGGVSRYIKMQYYFEDIKKQQDYSQPLEQALVNFALIVRNELVKAPMIDGVEAFLKVCLQQKIPCFLNSGGDQQELREVFSERGLDHFFSKILGSPKNKKENLSELISEGLLPSPSLFWGDAYSDYRAAKAYNMDFIYVSGVSEWHDGVQFCSKNKLLMVEDFNHELLS